MLQVNYSPFPVLETERLVLRRLAIQDADELYKIRSSKELMQHIARPVASCIEDVYRLIEQIDSGTEQNQTINWAITIKGVDKLIGTIGFVRIEKENYRAEVGYILAKEYHGKGLALEALQHVVAYGFNQMQLHSITAFVDVQNKRSSELLKKVGFVQEALFRENILFEGRFLDSAVYSLLAKSRK